MSFPSARSVLNAKRKETTHVYTCSRFDLCDFMFIHSTCIYAQIKTFSHSQVHLQFPQMRWKIFAVCFQVLYSDN